jgi:DHA2 family multidrug resistance protein
MLSDITSLSGRGDFFWPLVLRGLGLGMMFVPLTTLTLAELPPGELAQGTGLYNFFRQLGGSFGIAGVATLLVRYTQQMRARMVEHIAVGQPDVMGRIVALANGFLRSGADPAQAQRRALAILDGQVQNQANVLAYGKIYVISAALILTLIPLLVLVRRPARRGSGGHVLLE